MSEVCWEETILGLPTKIQEKIVRELDIKSMCIVSQVHPLLHDLTNPFGQIWKGFVERMGIPCEKIEKCRESASRITEKENYTGDTYSYKNLYLLLLFRRASNMMWITWMDNNYWRMEESSESIFGEIAHLDNVCWLDIAAAFRISIPGVYDVFWRLRLSGESISEPQLVVKSKTLGDKSFVFTKGIQSYMTGKDWVYMKVARLNIGTDGSKSSESVHKTKILDDKKNPIGDEYEIPVGSEDLHEEIQVKMFSHSDEWKEGLDIDFIEFVPVN